MFIFILFLIKKDIDLFIYPDRYLKCSPSFLCEALEAAGGSGSIAACQSSELQNFLRVRVSYDSCTGYAMNPSAS